MVRFQQFRCLYTEDDARGLRITEDKFLTSFFERIAAMIRIANSWAVGIFMVPELSWVFLLNYDWGE